MTTQTQYGGFWNRFAALFIDVLILIIPQFIFGYLLGSTFIARFNYRDPVLISMGYMLWAYLTAALISWIYFAAFESSAKQATPGKMSLGLIVTDTQGRRVSFGRASGRFWAKILSSLPLGLGYLLVAVTQRKQAFHDLLCQTLVQRQDYKHVVAKELESVGQDADASFYLQAHNELKTMTVDEGLWAKAFAAHPTEETLQRAYYLRMRAAQLSLAPQLLPKQQIGSLIKRFQGLPKKTKVIAGITAISLLGIIGGGVYYWYNNVYWKSHEGDPYFFLQYIDASGETFGYRKAYRIKYREGKCIYIWNDSWRGLSLLDWRRPDTIIDSSPREINISARDPFGYDDASNPIHWPSQYPFNINVYARALQDSVRNNPSMPGLRNFSTEFHLVPPRQPHK